MTHVTGSARRDERTFLMANLQSMTHIWQSYQLDNQLLTHFTNELKNFSIRLPLVGVFSAGKSSLLNFLLKDKLLAANINPETSLPAEIHYADDEHITLNVPDKSPAQLDRSRLREGDFSNMPDNTWLEIAAPFPPLRGLEMITLVDMPGWSSGNDRHSQAIDNYLWRSSAYCLVVSADEGGLKESLKRIIEELAINHKPMMLVVTKSDKKPANEIQQVCDHLQQEIETLTGTPLLSVSITNRTNTEQFAAALQKLAPLNARFFHQRVGKLGESLLGDLLLHLDKLRNTNNFTIDDISDQCEKLRQEQGVLNGEIEQTEQRLHSEIDAVENYIRREFENRLRNQLETLTSAVLYGGDMSGEVGAALRMAYTTGIENKLKPLIKNQLNHLEQLSAESLSNINFGHQFTIDDEQSSDLSSILSDVFPLLLGVLTKIPWLAPVAVVLKSVLSTFFNSVSADIAREEQQEKARQYILREFIPGCVAKVQSSIRQALASNIDSTIESISEEINRKIANYQQSLNQLEQQLKTEQVADEEKKVRIQQEYDVMSALLATLKEYANA